MAGPRSCWPPTEPPQSSCRNPQARPPAPAWTTRTPPDSRRGPRAAPTPDEARGRAAWFRSARRHWPAGAPAERHPAEEVRPERQPGKRPVDRHRPGQHPRGRLGTRRQRPAVLRCSPCLQTKQLPALPGSGAASCTSVTTILRLTVTLHPDRFPVKVPVQTRRDPGGSGWTPGCRKRHPRLRQTAGNNASPGGVRLGPGISSCSACRVSSGEKMLLQTPAAHELPTGGELSELSW